MISSLTLYNQLLYIPETRFSEHGFQSPFFTKLSLFTKSSLDKEYNMKKGAEVFSLNPVFH